MNDDAPMVGGTYSGTGLGQGTVRVLGVHRDSPGRWRARVEYIAGCLPNADGRLPVEEEWVSRAEWQRWQPVLVPAEGIEPAGTGTMLGGTESARAGRPRPRPRGGR